MQGVRGVLSDKGGISHNRAPVQFSLDSTTLLQVMMMLVYAEKRMGERIRPWGDPVFKTNKLDLKHILWSVL